MYTDQIRLNEIMAALKVKTSPEARKRRRKEQKKEEVVNYLREGCTLSQTPWEVTIASIRHGDQLFDYVPSEILEELLKEKKVIQRTKRCAFDYSIRIYELPLKE